MNMPGTGELRRVTYLDYDIGTFNVRGKVVVLAVEHDRDGVVAVHLINEVVCGLWGVEGIGDAIGLVGRLPSEQVRERLVRVDDGSHFRQVLIVAEKE